MKANEIIPMVMIGIPMFLAMIAITAIFLKQMWIVFKSMK